MTSNRIVFMVEDDRSLSDLMAYMLNREGFEVITENDGHVAQAKMNDLKQAPALVLLDLMLPLVDGYELLTFIRSKSSWDNVPVIVLSAKSHEQDIVRALDMGATDYVVKPFQPSELLARIERLTRGVSAI